MRLQVSRILKISWEAIKIPAPLVANFLKSADNSLLASGSNLTHLQAHQVDIR